ncbi:MAG: plastocyanin/azurin family copper-binding protein [Dehalococcoidia bacterium]
MLRLRMLTLGFVAIANLAVLACGDDDAPEATPTATAEVQRPLPTATATLTPTATATPASTPAATLTAAPTEEAPAPAATAVVTQAPVVEATQAPQPQSTQAPPPPPPPPPIATEPPPPPPAATEPPPVATEPPPPAPPTTVSVSINNLAFIPGNVVVTAGSTVVWSNRDQFPHDVTSSGGQFASSTLQRGDSFSATFATPGSYGYICTIHPFMAATVVVN